MNRPPVRRGSCRAAVPSTKARLARRLALLGSWSPRMALGPRRLSMNRCHVAADVHRRIPSRPPPHVGGYDSWILSRSNRNRELPVNRA